MKSVAIVQASLLSLPAVNRLFVQAVETHFTYFPEPVRHRVKAEHTTIHLLRAALDPRRVVLIARSGSRIIGYCLGTASSRGPAQIFWLYVDPEFRGANIGLSLLSRMLKLLRAKGAQSVYIATHDHRHYYERQGFKFQGKDIIDGVDMDILKFKLKV